MPFFKRIFRRRRKRIALKPVDRAPAEKPETPAAAPETPAEAPELSGLTPETPVEMPEAPAEPPKAPAEPSQSVLGALDELRYRARTGDPKLTDRHHKGNF